MTMSSTPPAVGIVATRSSMSSGPNFLNLILPSCGFRGPGTAGPAMILVPGAAPGGSRLAHYVGAGGERWRVAAGEGDLVHERAVAAKTNVGLRLARIRLDVD